MKWLFIGTIAIFLACNEQPKEYEEARETFESLVRGLRGADPSVLWDLADDVTRQMFSELAKELDEAATCIETYYPEKWRSEALRVLFSGMKGLDGSGRSLFLATIDTAKMRLSSDMLEIEKVERKGDVIWVVTKSGDTLEFIKDSEGRLRIVRLKDIFDKLPWSKTLRENIATAKQNCKAIADTKEKP